MNLNHQKRLLYLLIVFVTFAAISCKQSNGKREKFVIKNHIIELDTTIQQTFYFKEHYFCFTDNNRFLCLNNDFTVNSNLTNNINRVRFNYAFCSGDTLFAVSWSKNHLAKLFYLSDAFQWLPAERSAQKIIFKDQDFIVSSCCFGEFGGTISFQDKKTSKIYCCPATCAVSINKLQGTYFITSTLNHMDGSCQITRIANPRTLWEVSSDSLKDICNWWVVSKEIGELPKGAVKIIDTTGILSLGSFIARNQLYTISTDYKKTFINKIQNDSLLIVDTLFDQPLWSDQTTKYYGSLLIAPFATSDLTGFITIKNDSITIISFLSKN